MKTHSAYLSVLIVTLVSYSYGQTPSDSQKASAAPPTTQPIRESDQASNGAVVEISGENSNAIKLERARRIYENIIHDTAPIDRDLQKDAVDILNRLKKITPATQPAPAPNPDAVTPPKKTSLPTTKPAIAPGPAAIVPAGATTKPVIAPVVVYDRVPVDARDLDRLAQELRKEAVSIDEMMLSSSHNVVWLKPEVEKRFFHLARDLAGDSRTAVR